MLSAVSPASPARPRRRWVVRTALTVGVFLIGLLAVTGVELLKGSTLARGETGTSVGRVVDPRPVSADTTESTGLKVFGALGGTGGELLRHHARDPYPRWPPTRSHDDFAPTLGGPGVRGAASR